MKRLICILLALTLLGSLWACTTAPVEDTEGSEPPLSQTPPETDPPETDPPETDPPETEFVPPEGTLLTDEDLARYQQMFSYRLDRYAMHPKNWYNIALFVVFDSPENVNWDDFFMGGFSGSAPLSDAELAFVHANGFPIQLDAERLPVDEINAVAMQYFGLTIEESNQVGLEDMLYNTDTDSYYRYGGGAASVLDFEIHTGVLLEDGTIRLYYTRENSGEYVITLKSKLSEGETGYYILSNLPRES